MRVGFSSGTSLFSKVIKKMTRSEASHAYIVFESYGEELVLHSNGHGVGCEHYTAFNKRSEIVVEFELLLSPAEEMRAMAFALKQLLKPYDVWAIVGFAWVLVNKSFGRKVRQPFRNRSAYFCSELVITALQAGMFPLTHSMDREMVSPEDLIDFLDGHSMAKVVYHHSELTK
jgi:hypothetical protein